MIIFIGTCSERLGVGSAQIWDKVDQCDMPLSQAWYSLWCVHNQQSRSLSTTSSTSSWAPTKKKRQPTKLEFTSSCFLLSHRPPSYCSTSSNNSARWLSQLSVRCVSADRQHFHYTLQLFVTICIDASLQFIASSDISELSHGHFISVCFELCEWSIVIWPSIKMKDLKDF